MTWSIIAREADTGRIGWAGASRFFALGARVPFLAGGVGAVATQALLNPLYGPKGLDLLRQGRTAVQTVAALIAEDAGKDVRQVHVMDSHGGVAALTGADCVEWCGHLEFPHGSVAGNMLAGANVIEATAETYEARSDLHFAQRLIAALKAGEETGGDKRGRQSAAVVIVGDQDYSELDIRVDDHPNPIGELERLEAVSRQRWVHFRRFLPTRQDPVGTLDRSVIDREIARALADEAAKQP